MTYINARSADKHAYLQRKNGNPGQRTHDVNLGIELCNGKRFGNKVKYRRRNTDTMACVHEPNAHGQVIESVKG